MLFYHQRIDFCSSCYLKNAQIWRGERIRSKNEGAKRLKVFEFAGALLNINFLVISLVLWFPVCSSYYKCMIKENVGLAEVPRISKNDDMTCILDNVLWLLPVAVLGTAGPLFERFLLTKIILQVFSLKLLCHKGVFKCFPVVSFQFFLRCGSPSALPKVRGLGPWPPWPP